MKAHTSRWKWAHRYPFEVSRFGEEYIESLRSRLAHEIRERRRVERALTIWQEEYPVTCGEFDGCGKCDRLRSVK